MPIFYQQKLQISPILIGAKESFLKKIKSSSEMLFFLCICGHLDTGHKLCKGECDYPQFDNLNKRCECKKFESIEFSLKINISKLDLFKFENQDSLDEESPQFWLDFERWNDKCVKTMNITTQY